MDANTEFYNGLKTNFVNTVKESATSDEVIRYIVDKVNEHANTPFAKMVVRVLSKGHPSRDQFIKKVFDYVCHSVNYLRDPYGKEIVFTPQLLINRGKGDCKKQALFIATILKAAGIEPTLKVISYGGKDWEHIYVTVKGEHGETIILDPVNNKRYNEEINHSFSREYHLNGFKSKIMANQLQSMGGKDSDDFMHNYIGQPSADLIGYMDNSFGMGKRGGLKKFFHDAGEKLKKVVHVAEAAGFAPQRAAFLGLVLLGEALEKTPLKMHLADHLIKLWNKDNGAMLSKLWYDIGGNPKELAKVILKGHKTTIQGVGIKAHEFQEFHDIDEAFNKHLGSDPYIGQMAAVGAAIASAMPIVIKVKDMLQKSGLLNKDTLQKINGVMQKVLKHHDNSGKLTVDTKNNDVIQAGAAQDTGTGSGGGGAKKGCFLTTACCEYYKLPDDCYELTTLREFRDGYMRENYPEHINTYYEIAPIIVERINEDLNRDEIYKDMMAKIKLCCRAIETKEYDIAQALYTEEIIKFKKLYNLNQTPCTK